MRRITGLILIGLMICALAGCAEDTFSDMEEPVEQVQIPPVMDDVVKDMAVVNPYADLAVPTYVTKVDNLYFIVDCYHNQIIYHDNLEDPLTDWNVMTSDVNRPHTLASDGVFYLIDDTENNRILVMRKALNEAGETVFVQTQEFEETGVRPHYIIYHEASKTFYAWSSMTGEMYLFRREENGDKIELADIKRIRSLDGVYVRSFTIQDESIYFVSGNNNIIQAKLDSFKVQKEYPVVPEIAGMVQLTRIEDYYYITVSTDASGNQDYATILRTKDLDELADGNYEIVYDYFIGTGTPYNITWIDDKWYMTEHRIPGVGIWCFDVKENEILNAQVIY